MKKKYIKILLLTLIAITVLALASCSRCDHEYGEWIIKDATCTEAGSRSRECKKCKEVEDEKIAALGHDMVKVDDLAPTCNAHGYEGYSECSRCGYCEGKKPDALGHDIKDGTCLRCDTENLLILIENGKANFKVVSTAASGA